VENAVPQKILGKRKQKHFSEPELNAIRKCKITFSKWKSLGRPPHPHPAKVEMADAQKQLRRLQRVSEARRRHDNYSQIMEASEFDNKFFYKLIARQRKTNSNSTLTLNVNGNAYEGDHDVAQGWREYFADLATPKNSSKYDSSYKQSVSNINNMIRDNENLDSTLLPVTRPEVQYYISKLNNGKAADENGLTAEHLKFAGPTVLEALAHIITASANLRYIPSSMKSGVLTPVYKKGGKPLDNPSSYRGITVCSLLSKVLEQFIATHTEALLRPHQSGLQYGFTKGLSPAHAALLVTEAIAEQRDSKCPLYIATLDAQKAFDVVDHDSLMWKWHERGLRGILWHLKDNSYVNMTSKTKWKGLLSQPFDIKQGVRQGGIPSTTDYKLYIDPLLKDFETSDVGLHIGSTYVGSPTCADDIVLLTKSIFSLQYLVTTAEHYAKKEHYTIHPTKSVVSVYNSGVQNTTWNELAPWHMDQEPMTVTAITTHLGVTRTAESSTTVSPFISERLKIGRRSLYALMGAGLHGLNGLSPTTSFKLYLTYILPRLISAVETVVLNQTEKNALEGFHRGTLRQIQNLPPRTAIPAIYLLMGALPIEAELDKRKLTLFGSIVRDKVPKICNIAERQLVMKDLDSKSWFCEIVQLAYQYGLPSPHDILESPPSKGVWKNQIARAVTYYWSTKLKQKAAKMSTLKYLTTGNFNRSDSNTHPLWATTELATRDIQRACYQVKMATGTYMLQTHRNIYSNKQEKATCPLCTTGAPEDYVHFTAECPDTAAERSWFLARANIPNIPSLVTQAALDPTPLVPTYGEELYALSRLYCFKLHCNRAVKLGYRPYPGAKVQTTDTLPKATNVQTQPTTGEGGMVTVTGYHAGCPADRGKFS
jgi:hypothetical protein